MTNTAVWPYAKPAEIYISHESGHISDPKLYCGHALLRLCDEFDEVSVRATDDLTETRIEACGLSFAQRHPGGYTARTAFGARLHGALLETLAAMFPTCAPRLASEDPENGLVRGISVGDALEHPFYQAALGLRSAEDFARWRMELRDGILECVGLPPMRDETRAAIWDYLAQETRLLEIPMTERFKWLVAHDDCEGRLAAEGLPWLRHLLFREEGDHGWTRNSEANRLHFLSGHPGAEALFTPRRPESELLCAIRDAVQVETKVGMAGRVADRIGAETWMTFTRNPGGFIAGALPRAA